MHLFRSASGTLLQFRWASLDKHDINRFFTPPLIAESVPTRPDRPVICPAAAQAGRSFKLDCRANGSNSKVMDIISEPSIYDNEATSLPQFRSFFIALALSWIGMAVVVSVGDAICFDLLGEKHRLYGRQRLWGAVGWGVFSILAGWLVDETSAYSFHKDYSIVFYLMLAAIFPDVIVSTCLTYNPNKISSNIVKDIGKLFSSMRIVVFFLWCIVVGLCTALVWNFLFWHLEDLADREVGCDQQARMKTLQGLAMGIQCFGGELPFFFISGWLLNKIGHINAMTLVLFTFGARLFLYSLLSNPWMVLPIELMQGITFGVFYSTMATYASIVAPAGTAATLQVCESHQICHFRHSFWRWFPHFLFFRASLGPFSKVSACQLAVSSVDISWKRLAAVTHSDFLV